MNANKGLIDFASLRFIDPSPQQSRRHEILEIAVLTTLTVAIIVIQFSQYDTASEHPKFVGGKHKIMTEYSAQRWQSSNRSAQAAAGKSGSNWTRFDNHADMKHFVGSIGQCITNHARDRRPIRIIECNHASHVQDSVDAQKIGHHIVKLMTAVDKRKLNSQPLSFQIG